MTWGIADLFLKMTRYLALDFIRIGSLFYYARVGAFSFSLRTEECIVVLPIGGGGLIMILHHIDGCWKF